MHGWPFASRSLAITCLLRDARPRDRQRRAAKRSTAGSYADLFDPDMVLWLMDDFQEVGIDVRLKTNVTRVRVNLRHEPTLCRCFSPIEYRLSR